MTTDEASSPAPTPVESELGSHGGDVIGDAEHDPETRPNTREVVVRKHKTAEVSHQATLPCRPLCSNGCGVTK